MLRITINDEVFLEAQRICTNFSQPFMMQNAFRSVFLQFGGIRHFN